MAAAITGSGERPSIKELKNALHTRCSQGSSDRLYTQHDLLEMDVIPDHSITLLMECVNALLNEKLMNVLVRDGQPVWKVVKKVDAARYVQI